MRVDFTGTIGAIFICMVPWVSTDVRAETASEWVTTDQSRIRLISEYDGTKGQETLFLGLEVQLQKGWKIYWRSPGDAGIPPQFDWNGSQNLKKASVQWPLPEQFDVFGLATWGYHDEVLYPIKMELVEPGNPLFVKLHLFFGICEQICIPYEHEFILELGALTGAPSKYATLIKDSIKKVPLPIGDSSNSLIASAEAVALDGQNFRVTATSGYQLETPGIFVEGMEGSYFSLKSTSLSQNGHSVEFVLTADFPEQADMIAGQNITVTIFDKGTGSEGALRVAK